MQIHFSQAQRTDEPLLGNPLLLYTGKLEKEDMDYPRIAHTHPDFVEFIYILEGSGEYEIANRWYPVSRGDLVIYNSGVSHYEFAHNQRLPLLYCAASRIQLPGLGPNQVLTESVSPVLHLRKDQPLIPLLLEKLFETALLDICQGPALCQALFQAFLHLVLEAAETAEQVEHESSSVPQIGQDIRSYVDRQPLKTLSVSQTAQAFGISESYLARVFRKSFGCSLMEYIIRKRIGEAQSLLMTTTLSIQEISEYVGYQNQSYFGKVFAEHVGLPPLRYRKIHRRQNAPEVPEP